MIKQARFSQSVADSLLLFVAFAWGSTYLAAKEILSVQSLFTFLALRFSIASLLAFPFVLRPLRKMNRQSWQGGILLGVLLTIGIIVETLGIASTSPTNAGVLIAMTIIFVPLIESIAFKGVPLKALLLPTVVSVIGCALLTVHGSLILNFGDLLILLAAVIRAVHLVATRRLASANVHEGSLLNVVQFGVVGATALLVALSSGHFTTDIAHTDARTWSILIYMAVFCTVFAFYIQFRALQFTTASRVGLMLGMEPVFAAFFGVTLGGAKLSALGWVGVATIVGATYWGRAVLNRPEDNGRPCVT